MTECELPAEVEEQLFSRRSGWNSLDRAFRRIAS
jgi:hypothetical protein